MLFAFYYRWNMHESSIWTQAKQVIYIYNYIVYITYNIIYSDIYYLYIYSILFFILIYLCTLLYIYNFVFKIYIYIYLEYTRGDI
jgi:hypothetical protein